MPKKLWFGVRLPHENHLIWGLGVDSVAPLL